MLTSRQTLVAPEPPGRRLDVALHDALNGPSRAVIQRWIEEGRVWVNGRPARPGTRLEPGDRIDWEAPDAPATSDGLHGEAIPLDVVYEDADILVINKPIGMVVHPAPGHASGTLVNAVLGRGEALADEAGSDRPGVVHRLDRDTSGLLVIARSNEAHRSLQRQIQERTAERRYVGVLAGSPRFECATVDAPIGRHPRNRQKMAVIPPGSAHTHRDALTELRVLERFPGYSFVEFRLQTGRTHQIRVHCAYIHFPVVGDPVYGPAGRPGGFIEPAVRKAVEALPGQALHAYRLSFDQPTTGERLSFLAPLPEPMRNLLTALGSRWEPRADDPWREIPRDIVSV